MKDCTKLLSQFTGDIKFLRHIESYEFSPDSFAHEIETNHGNFLIVELDFVSSIDEVLNLASSVGNYRNFIPVKKQLVFEKS